MFDPEITEVMKTMKPVAKISLESTLSGLVAGLSGLSNELVGFVRDKRKCALTETFVRLNECGNQQCLDIAKLLGEQIEALSKFE